MDRKPFEIIADCEMAAFPTSADIARFGEQIEKARRREPEVVRATVKPPATYREKHYRLPTQFVVWAKDSLGAMQAVAALLEKTGVPCRVVLPSGRALVEADVPPPSGQEKPAAVGPSAAAPRLRARKKPRTLKTGTRHKSRAVTRHKTRAL